MRDARRLLEALVVIAATWLVLGWLFDRPFMQSDGSWLVLPYTRSALEAGADWTHHLYRFGVVGGSEMHPFAGTPPLLQLCAALGVPATTTANLGTLFLQLAFAFFGVRLVEALATVWSGATVELAAVQRIAAIWLCAFAPLLGWRIAIGHENLVLGLLPLYVTMSLVWSARAGQVTRPALVFGALVVFDAVTGLGPQMLVYSAIFGAPLVLASVLGARWTWAHTRVVAVLAAGILLALPRLVPMIAHATGPDASRTLGESVTYSFGAGSLPGWIVSVMWTAAGNHYNGAHEYNYPVGPLLLVLVVLWPYVRTRRVLVAAAASLLVAILFADDVRPVSTVLLDVLPPLRAFRVPMRAAMPVLVFVPVFALAALACVPGRRDRRVEWLAVAIGAVLIVAGRGIADWAREPVAWLGCAALVIAARRMPARTPVVAAVAVIAALGVLAFDERFPRDLVVDPIEAGPHELNRLVHAQAPELVTALDRVQVMDEPLPYGVSTAFAAGLPSIDGVWYPPRYFLDLISALGPVKMPSTTCVFGFAREPEFPVLQQLYNIRVAVHAGGREITVQALPATNGPAWFVEQVSAHVAEMPGALRAASELREAIRHTAWTTDPAARGCTGAHVGTVATLDHGQRAVIAVDAPARCTLVVATNYTSTLRARAGDRELPTFPVDIALTGIDVPAGATSVELAPVVAIPLWSRIAQLLGLVLLVAGVLREHGARDRTEPAVA